MSNKLEIDWSKITDLLQYDPQHPLIFSSGLFLFFFLVFTLFYALLYKKLKLRILYIVLFSLYFYYKSSGNYFLLLILVSFSDFMIGWGVYRSENRTKRRWLTALSIVLDLGLLVYFKYTNMFIDLVNHFRTEQIGFADLFLPVGISFFTFQSLSYIIDIYRNRIRPLNSWLD